MTMIKRSNDEAIVTTKQQSIINFDFDNQDEDADDLWISCIIEHATTVTGNATASSHSEEQPCHSNRRQQREKIVFWLFQKDHDGTKNSNDDESVASKQQQAPWDFLLQRMNSLIPQQQQQETTATSNTMKAVSTNSQSPPRATVDIQQDFDDNSSSGALEALPKCKDPLFGDLEDEEATVDTLHSLDSQSSSIKQQQQDEVANPDESNDSHDNALAAYSSTTLVRAERRRGAMASFAHATGTWTHKLLQLVQSREMAELAESTVHLTASASSLAVHTALLPVTVPVQLVRFTFQTYTGTLMFAFRLVRQPFRHRHHHHHHHRLEQEPSQDHPTGPETASQDRGAADVTEPSQPKPQPLIHKIVGFPGWACGVAGQAAQGVGGHLLEMIAPGLGGYANEHHRDSSKKLETVDTVDYLKKLRLDFEEGDAEVPSTNKPLLLLSKYLLRVDEVDLVVKDETVFYLDLDDPSRDATLLNEALNRLVACGLTLLSNHPTVRLSKAPADAKRPAIQWNPEGSTTDLLRRCANTSAVDRVGILSRETLLWSGSYSPTEYNNVYGQDCPIFLGRGLVPRSPRDFMELLWDDTRTNEYNNFCMGRKTLLPIMELQSNVATKVVRSETRIPFTNMSVPTVCMMHVRPLPGGPEEGYVILTRGLHVGPAASHQTQPSADHPECAEDNDERSKSEIVWGLNILRRVARHAECTDLTSVSQVRSKLVPKFMAKRIGLIGVEEFFKNVRETKNPPANSKPL